MNERSATTTERTSGQEKERIQGTMNEAPPNAFDGRRRLESVDELLDSGMLKVDSCAIAGHVRPDADCICAAAALKEFLERRGADADILPLELPSTLRPLCERFEIRFERRRNEYDLLVIVDTASAERVSPPLAASRSGLQYGSSLCVDHHISNMFFADTTLCLPGASSTCELMAELYLKAGERHSERTAGLLFAGIAADTGFFRYPSTSAATFAHAARLVECGASAPLTSSLLLDTLSESELRIALECVAEGRLDPRTRTFVMELGDPALHHLVPVAFDFAGRLETAEVLVCICPVDSGRYVVELRSRGRIDVNEAAERLGGGGHRCAAGCTIDTEGGVVEVKRLVLEQMRKALNNRKA